MFIYCAVAKLITPQIPHCRESEIFPYILLNIESRDGSVGIAMGYGLDDRDSRVRFSAGVENFSLHHHVQNDSGAHPASYPMGTSGSFPGGKAVGP
jgi:hypothetical protein